MKRYRITFAGGSDCLFFIIYHPFSYFYGSLLVQRLLIKMLMKRTDEKNVVCCHLNWKYQRYCIGPPINKLIQELFFFLFTTIRIQWQEIALSVTQAAVYIALAGSNPEFFIQKMLVRRDVEGVCFSHWQAL